MKADGACPCGSGVTYAQCCQPLHRSERDDITAEQLMRSRYSAYVVGDIAYLRQTWHPDTLAAAPKFGDAMDTHWLGLRILDRPAPQERFATVEFVAFFEEGEKVQQLRERSRFERINAKWRYLDGEFLPPLKLSRNDSCCCGSGRKQKKCHPEC